MRDSGGQALGVSVDTAAHVFVTGMFSKEIDFGADKLVATGPSVNAFLAKLAP